MKVILVYTDSQDSYISNTKILRGVAADDKSARDFLIENYFTTSTDFERDVELGYIVLTPVTVYDMSR